jgi:hypothetical protein
MEAEASSLVVDDNGMVVSTRCDQCQEMYAERNPPGEPPCESCWVDVMPCNVEALRIYNLVQDQFIMGMGGPVAINHMAVHSAMELEEVKERKACFRKVLALANRKISKINSQET